MHNTIITFISISALSSVAITADFSPAQMRNRERLGAEYCNFVDARVKDAENYVDNSLPSNYAIRPVLTPKDFTDLVNNHGELNFIIDDVDTTLTADLSEEALAILKTPLKAANWRAIAVLDSFTSRWRTTKAKPRRFVYHIWDAENFFNPKGCETLTTLVFK